MRLVPLGNLQQLTAVQLLSDPGHIGGPVLIPSCAVIRIGWLLDDGKVGYNILYGRYSGTFAGTTAQCDAIKSALGSGSTWTALAAFFPTSTALANISLRDVNTANNPFITSTTAGAFGTSVGSALPNEVSAVITTRTAKTGIANRGRLYVPGWASNAMGTGNIIASGAVTALQNWGGLITGALSAQGYTWVIGQPARAAYTGSTGTSHPARSATSTPITSVVVRDNHWDSQRRRGLK